MSRLDLWQQTFQAHVLSLVKIGQSWRWSSVFNLYHHDSKLTAAQAHDFHNNMIKNDSQPFVDDSVQNSTMLWQQKLFPVQSNDQLNHISSAKSKKDLPWQNSYIARNASHFTAKRASSAFVMIERLSTNTRWPRADRPLRWSAPTGSESNSKISEVEFL